MTALLAPGEWTALANQLAAKQAGERLRDFIAEMLGGGAEIALTIAGGVVTPTRGTHTIDTEGAAATDDLDTIAQTNHPEGRYLWLRCANAARVVTIRHNQGAAGKVLMTDSANFVLNSTKKSILLKRVGTTWEEVDRFYGDRIEEMRAWLQVEPDTVSTSADRNITAADRGKVITLTGATPRTFTFTATPSQLGDGWECVVKNAATADLTVNPASGTIDSKASLVVKPGELMKLRSDAANMDVQAARLLWRERLAAPRTYFVRLDGNDANTGLANTSGGAFATLQKAWDTIHGALDLAGHAVAVKIGNGTLTAGMVARGRCVGQKGYESIVFESNSGTPADVVISTTSSSCFQAYVGAMFTVKNLKVQTTTAGNCLGCFDAGSRLIFQNLDFGACAGNHMQAGVGGYIAGEAGTNYTISGGAVRHMLAAAGGTIFVAAMGTITLSGTPAFSQEFAAFDDLGLIEAYSNTYSGAATGKRYEGTGSAVCFTNGAGPNYFPGNAAGTVASDAQYL